VLAVRDGERVWVWCDGIVHVFDRARRSRGAADHGSDLAAPMPGRVRRLLAAPGQSVARGAVLVALEAMKMEHAIRSPRDGVVKRVLVREGDLVDAGAELVELEPPGA
jgi:3-methylcrotonyl-CoA carboxylase alpha subunit